MKTYTSIEKSYVHDIYDTTGESDYISTTILVSTDGETVFFQDSYVNRDTVSEFEWQVALDELEKFKASKSVKKGGKLPLIRGATTSRVISCTLERKRRKPLPKATKFVLDS